jgi:hypothetical protein
MNLVQMVRNMRRLRAVALYGWALAGLFAIALLAR